ncbi:MAG: hypothetical protein NPIRA04_21810 [Nitrospirales bacterium]|nr:MAG: hypothetical protein NPIRA04_21810 [Nitrospirales bacterium]
MRIEKHDALKYVVRAAECLLEPWREGESIFAQDLGLKTFHGWAGADEIPIAIHIINS